MTRTLTVILIFLGTFAFVQRVQIDTFHLKQSEKLKQDPAGKMNFPLIHTGDEKTDSIINTDLKTGSPETNTQTKPWIQP